MLTRVFNFKIEMPADGADSARQADFPAVSSVPTSWCDDSVSTAAVQVTEPAVSAAAAPSFELKVASEQCRAASQQTAELVAAAVQDTQTAPEQKLQRAIS